MVVEIPLGAVRKWAKRAPALAARTSSDETCRGWNAAARASIPIRRRSLALFAAELCLKRD
jgi:hypothetical protein